MIRSFLHNLIGFGHAKATLKQPLRHRYRFNSIPYVIRQQRHAIGRVIVQVLKDMGDFDRSGADSAIQNEGLFVLLRANRWKRVVFKRKNISERRYPEVGDDARICFLTFNEKNMLRD